MNFQSAFSNMSDQELHYLVSLGSDFRNIATGRASLSNTEGAKAELERRLRERAAQGGEAR